MFISKRQFAGNKTNIIIDCLLLYIVTFVFFYCLVNIMAIMRSRYKRGNECGKCGKVILSTIDTTYG